MAPMLVPFDWNVIVAGAWNQAILTPAWIQRRMFESDQSVVEVQVPLDGPGPVGVSFGGLTVQVASNSVVVVPSDLKLSELSRASKLAARAVSSLPETPVFACGINARYKLGNSEIVDNLCNCSIDGAVTNIGAEIQSRQLQRAIKYNEGPLSAGIVNLILTEDDAGATSVAFNFHRAGGVTGAISEWLHLDEETLRASIRTLLLECFEISDEVI